MKPMSFSLENCNELIPDSRRRALSSEARKFADAGHPVRRVWPKEYSTYWSYVVKEHEKLFWKDVYFRRVERLKRKAAQHDS